MARGGGGTGQGRAGGGAVRHFFTGGRGTGCAHLTSVRYGEKVSLHI